MTTLNFLSIEDLTNNYTQYRGGMHFDEYITLKFKSNFFGQLNLFRNIIFNQNNFLTEPVKLHSTTKYIFNKSLDQIQHITEQLETLTELNTGEIWEYKKNLFEHLNNIIILVQTR